MDSITSGTLAQIDKARQFLESFTGTPEEVEEIRDRASAWAEFFRHCQTGLAAQNTAAELKIRCERKLGAMLPEPRPVGRPSKNGHGVELPGGISTQAAKRYRKIAAIPDIEFENYLLDTKHSDLELTTAGVLRLYNALHREPKNGDTVREPDAPSVADKAPDLDPADEILSNLTNLTRRLTVFLNTTVEGQKFKDYLLACNLGHFLDTRDITIRLDDGTYKTMPVRWRGFGALRWFLKLAKGKGLKGAGQVRAAFEAAKRDDPDAGVWPGDLAEGEVLE